MVIIANVVTAYFQFHRHEISLDQEECSLEELLFMVVFSLSFNFVSLIIELIGVALAKWGKPFTWCFVLSLLDAATSIYGNYSLAKRTEGIIFDVPQNICNIVVFLVLFVLTYRWAKKCQQRHEAAESQSNGNNIISPTIGKASEMPTRFSPNDRTFDDNGSQNYEIDNSSNSKEDCLHDSVFVEASRKSFPSFPNYAEIDDGSDYADVGEEIEFDDAGFEIEDVDDSAHIESIEASGQQSVNGSNCSDRTQPEQPKPISENKINYCFNCGAKVIHEGNYCWKCGAALNGASNTDSKLK